MGRRTRVSNPLCRIMPKHHDSHPTCMIIGPNRHTTWLTVHAPTPTLLRLHPPVVGFLHEALTQIVTTADPSLTLTLAKDTQLYFPACVVTGCRDGEAWLYVCAATPSAVRLHRRLIQFLREALADLPATPPIDAKPADRTGPPPLASIS